MKVQDGYAVVGDIGGTNARFGIVNLRDLTIDRFECFQCAKFRSLKHVLSAYLGQLPGQPDAISLAVAGPVADGAVEMTNLPWAITTAEISRIAGVDRICLVNDFHALALSLPYLTSDDFCELSRSSGSADGAMAVLGAGTGLGVAAVVRAGDNWIPLAAEGGHIAFAPQTAEEFKIVSHLSRDIGYISYEHMLSGSGLARLYGALRLERDNAVDTPEIVRRATIGGDIIAIKTVRLFCVWLGRLAGDLALLYGAQGGVYIAGGIAPRLLSFLSDGHFHSAFSSKGELSAYLETIPIRLVTTQCAGLLGAAVAMMKSEGWDMQRFR